MEENKNIDTLIDNLMIDDELASTSLHFTDTIMAEVEQLNQPKTFEYKPLISKKVWLLIASFSLGIFTYIAFYGNLTKSKWTSFFEFNLNLNFLSELNFSNTTLYATIIVSLLFFIQILLLKKHFSKQLSL